MKKIFTLLFALIMLSQAQAQSGQRDDRDFDRRNDQQNDQRYDQEKDRQYEQDYFEKGYDRKKFIKENDDFFDDDRDRGRDGRFVSRFSMERKMKMRIASINREYDYKIERVKRNYFMSWYEKQRKIRYLENERRWEIRMVYAKFNNMRFDDYYRGRGHGGHF